MTTLFLMLAMLVPPSGFVTDNAHILGDTAAMADKLQKFERETSIELVVVTTPSLDGLTVENYTSMLWAQWGVGKSRTNNGVMIVLAPTERKLRVQRGSGLVDRLPQRTTDEIIRQMTPALRAGNYSAAVWSGIGAVKAALTRPQSPIEDHDETDWTFVLLAMLFLGVVIFVIVFVSLDRPSRRYASSYSGGSYRGYGGGGYGGHTSINQSSTYVHVDSGHHHSSSGGWGSSSDSGGGGWGGGGDSGGSSDGGGSSGDW